MDETPQRRFSDRDAHLNARLDEMERENRKLAFQVTTLESNLNIVKIEQGHLKELLDQRFRVIEKGQELVTAKLDHLSADIQGMASDAGKTPAGRDLANRIITTQATVDAHDGDIESFKNWKGHIEGALTVVRWMGIAGVTSCVVWIFRLLRIIP